MRSTSAGADVLCPSAQPDMVGSELFAVVSGSAEKPMAAYLNHTLPVTTDLLARSGPVEPTEVFRFAAPCAARACIHFDGTLCQLGRRAATLLPAVVDRLPSCLVRPRCRWFREQGGAACLRCPAIVTRDYRAVPLTAAVASGEDQLAQGGSR